MGKTITTPATGGGDCRTEWNYVPPAYSGVKQKKKTPDDAGA
jgi:hypothetical protein